MSGWSRVLLLIASIACFACPRHVHAWFDTGHMVVAEIAYRNLDPEARRRVGALLSAVNLDQRTNEFRTASCWADDHKTREDGVWHYINWFIKPDGSPGKGQPLKENVVWAISKFRSQLGDRNERDAVRGQALVWLLHLVGDCHQPMHSVARESATAPNGDRGGNDFPIVSPSFISPPVRNLHFLWDSGGGLFPQVVRPLNDVGQRTIAGLADRAVKAYPKNRATWALRPYQPEVWAKESFELAKTQAYRLEEGKLPSDSYISACQETSLKRVAMAGYRLAHLINEAVKKG